MLSWKIPASLGSSSPEVKRLASFSGTGPIRPHLPGLRFLVVFVVFVVLFALFVVVSIIVVVFIVELAIEVVLEMETKCKGRRLVCVCHDAGSVAGGFGLSRFGGGYVDQKWRPQRGHTQNWSGVQGMSGPGSRSSMSAPQR